MIKGIQNLSREDIELKVIEVLEYFDKKILETPVVTPIFEFVSHLQKEYNILIDFTKDLGNTKSGGKILGLFNLKPRGIYIDKILNNDVRLNFTLAHEIGHLIFHRKLIFEQEEYENFSDTEFDLITGKHILRTDRDWIEWQANYFASAFLMPKESIKQVVIETQKKLGITRNIGSIYLDKNAYSIRDYNLIRGELQKVFIVNLTNIDCRLKDLGILNDQSLKDVKHIYRLFKEE